MRILVTFAVEAEFAPWRKLRRFTRIEPESREFFTSKIGNADLAVLLTGMSCRKAGVEATKVIWDGDIDVCISSGLAGGLRVEHVAGEVLVASQVVAAESDRVIQSDAALVSAAV